MRFKRIVAVLIAAMLLISQFVSSNIMPVYAANSGVEEPEGQSEPAQSDIEDEDMTDGQNFDESGEGSQNDSTAEESPAQKPAEENGSTEDSSEEQSEESHVTEDPEKTEESEEGPDENSEESSSEESEISEEESKEDSEESKEEDKEKEEDNLPDEETADIVARIKKVCSGVKLAAKIDIYEEELSKFPASYQTHLEALHKKYPDWVFVADKTGLDWNEVIDAESSQDRSLVTTAAADFLKSNAPGDYNASTGRYVYKDNTAWVTANKPMVAYCMDPRNFLNEEYIWMFEGNQFEKSAHTVNAVEKALTGTFMTEANSPKIKYLNAKGKTVTLDVTYAEAIYAAGKEIGMSPLWMASKIRLEIGANGSGSSRGRYTTDTGATYNGNTLNGIYNYYNIAANDSADPVRLCLSWAAGYPNSRGNPTATSYGRPWTSPVISIRYGAQYVYDNYFQSGQSTGYYTRFNVTPQAKANGNLYWHQYMTNVSGAITEASTTYYAYKRMSLLSAPRVFRIPVFNNMPALNEMPKISQSIHKGVTNTAVNMREEPTSASNLIVTVPSGNAVTILEGSIDTTPFAWNFFYYPYWYKVKTTVNGKEYTGYLCANYVDANQNREVAIGGTVKLSMRNDLNQRVFYQSSDPAIATVAQDGTVKGIKAGNVEIYAFTAHGFDSIGIKVSKSGNTIIVSEEKIPVYTVKFNTNGGTPKASSKKIEEGDALGTLPKVTKEGYTFAGWYLEKSFKTKATEGTQITKSRTIYAKWRRNVSACEIKVEAQQFNGEALKPEVIVTCDGAELVKGTDYKVSYSDNKMPGTATVKITGKGNWAGNKTATFEIKATKVKYKSLYYVNVRKGPGTGYKAIGMTAPSQVVYVVNGYEHSDGTNNWCVIEYDGDYAYIAKDFLEKVPVKYKVTFNAMGGTCSKKSKSVTEGKKIGSLPTPKKEGYIFKGWYTKKTGGKKIKTSYIIKKKQTVYARWVAE